VGRGAKKHIDDEDRWTKQKKNKRGEAAMNMHPLDKA